MMSLGSQVTKVGWSLHKNMITIMQNKGFQLWLEIRRDGTLTGHNMVLKK